jgi:very-short-patch-repair endonuclease
MNSPRAPLFKKRGGRSVVFNIKETLQKRKLLRKDQTEAEKQLWESLRSKRFNSLKFSRQYGIGHYIADFYCPALKLAIELDGHKHFSEAGVEYDRERSKYFSAIGIKTIRFSNKDALKNLCTVLANIEETLLELKASPSLFKEGERGS